VTRETIKPSRFNVIGTRIVGALPHPLSEPEFAGFPECRGVLHTPNMPTLGECNSPLRNHRGYRGSDSLKPEFFRNSEHIFVKGAEDNVLSFDVFFEIKSSGKMNGIKASAICEFFVLNYDLFYGFVYRFVINIFKHFIKFVSFFRQPRIIVFVIRYFVSSAQGYVGFYSEQKRTQTKIGIAPQGMCFAISFLVEQDCKQNGRIKIGYHALESIRSCFIVNSPEIYSFFWFSGQFWFAVGCGQNHSASSSFFFKPLFESLLMSNFYLCNRSSADFCLRFLNSGSLHNKNIEKEFPIHPPTKGVSP